MCFRRGRTSSEAYVRLLDLFEDVMNSVTIGCDFSCELPSGMFSREERLDALRHTLPDLILKDESSKHS